MIKAMRTAASGMMAQQTNVDNIANNLANVNTAGFKRSKIEFQDVLYQNYRKAGTATALGSAVPRNCQSVTAPELWRRFATTLKAT